MLKNIYKAIQVGDFMSASSQCACNEYLYKNCMLFYYLYGLASAASSKNTFAIDLFIKAIQTAGPHKLAAKCYQELAKIAAPSISPRLEIAGYNSKLLLTMTTCHRPELLRRTLTSALKFTDISLAKHALIVDDAPDGTVQPICEEVLRPNRIKYTVVEKPAAARGHPQSLNLILAAARAGGYEYIIHLEDDFEFYFPFSLIISCLRVLEFNDNYGQCLFNNGYKESIRENISAAPYGRAREAGGIRFYEHIFSPAAHVNPCSYWPHFSLRPGVYRVAALTEDFLECGSFEKEYAARYVDAGWKTAYLEGVYCEHIGRKTSERFGGAPNAYTLNNTVQFSHIPIQTFMVHLERRGDRLSSMQWPCEPNITLWPAVDGRKLVPSAELNGLFRDNIVDMKPGIVGCALSHLKLWLKLLENYKRAPAFFVLEDDVKFVDDFKGKWHSVLGLLAMHFEPWDVLFLGYHGGNTAVASAGLFQPKTAAAALEFSRGGTFAYIINHTGARKLLAFIEACGMINAIDTVMQRCIDAGLRVLYLSEPLVFSTENSPDTDIQISESCIYQESLTRATWPEIKRFIAAC